MKKFVILQINDKIVNKYLFYKNLYINRRYSSSKKIIKNEPQPLSITDNGGKIIANNTLKKLIYNLVSCKVRRLSTCFVTGFYVF